MPPRLLAGFRSGNKYNAASPVVRGRNSLTNSVAVSWQSDYEFSAIFTQVQPKPGHPGPLEWDGVSGRSRSIPGAARVSGLPGEWSSFDQAAELEDRKDDAHRDEAD